MVWRYPALNTKCRHFLKNIQLWLNYIELMIWLSTQSIYILDNTTILDICRLSHGSCFVYYSPELLPSRNPSTNRKTIEKDRTFSRFALSFYSLYYTSAASEQSRYYMSMCKTVAAILFVYRTNGRLLTTETSLAELQTLICTEIWCRIFSTLPITDWTSVAGI